MLSDALMMMDDFRHDEPQELLAEHRIEARLLRQRTQPGHLLALAGRVGGGQADGGLVAADVLGDLEPLGQEVDQRGVDVVDARRGSERACRSWGRQPWRPRPYKIDGIEAWGRRALRSGLVPDSSSLPLLFVDHPFPEVYLDLVDGRATIVGSGTDDGLERADAILAGAVRPWNTAAFALAPRCTVISRVGVGYDNVSVSDATAAGVVVCNTPMAPMVSTAEHTMALLFAVTKHLPHHIARARQGLKGEPVGRALELDGMTLGLVGIGRIASRVAIAAQALGMRVIACDPGVATSPLPGVDLVEFDTVLADADVLSLHAPALPSTRQMINADTLARMKPGAYLVNCARGVLVDHDALLAAIDSGRLAGAGLDVTDPEPLPAGHPLLERANVVVTPRIASASVAGRRRLYEHSIENTLAVLEGRPADIVVA